RRGQRSRRCITTIACCACSSSTTRCCRSSSSGWSGSGVVAHGRTAPPRLLPLLYLGAAHVALGLACGLAGARPEAVAGFFYHSWMVGVVHLVTLGWITLSIMGAIYIVGPIALRTRVPVRRSDYVAYALTGIGVAGMGAHFWIQEYRGMAWSAALVAAGVLWTTARIARTVSRAPIQRSARWLITFACGNIWIAASTGLLIAWDKTEHFLPGFVLANVFAHAHLAALGWATMMVIGVGSRLVPMTLPSKMPDRRMMEAAAILLET